MVKRCHIRLRGRVQGVGFRPFVHSLATTQTLAGWVANDGDAVIIEVEGTEAALEGFLCGLTTGLPSHAEISDLRKEWMAPRGDAGFEIRGSVGNDAVIRSIPADLATCPECLAEILAPANRRHRYPFTNCTHCGPRFSMILAMPYDRRNTTMVGFSMCPECLREYSDPSNRRFHAQPNACPVCGPRLSYASPGISTPLLDEAALQSAVRDLRAGAIVAVKGLGGFHLMADAGDSDAVSRLRARKRRGGKPFALMVPDIAFAESVALLCAVERGLLQSPQAPIVLLLRRPGATAGICVEVAPDGDTLGIMLPYTPLHHLLMRELGCPVVATSGNLSEEPICIDNDEARLRLSGIADAFLMHNRPIARPVDDSVAQVVSGRVQLLRRSRGYAPLPVPLHPPADGVLAAGGHLKNTFAIGVGGHAVISQHIGDLENEEGLRVFDAGIRDLRAMLRQPCEQAVCDLHPDYLSGQRVRADFARVEGVQHHAAHVAACLAENQWDGPALGVSWDGTGVGGDGTIWGGEWFLAEPGLPLRRVARLRTFPLPGGDAAIREPRRSALGLLSEMDLRTLGDPGLCAGREASFSPSELRTLVSILSNPALSPHTSSMGRLFDAVSCLLGLCDRSEYEGQAATRLEALGRGGAGGRERGAGKRAEGGGRESDNNEGWETGDGRQGKGVGEYPFSVAVIDSGLWEYDWQPMIAALLGDLQARQAPARIAMRFHNTLAAMIHDSALRLRSRTIALSGGCFQNRLLSERVNERLAKNAITVLSHHLVPPNDGGLSYGQLALFGRIGILTGAGRG